MIDDFAGGPPPRKKPKIIYPPDKADGPSIHELAAKEGHDMDVEAAGPEASAAMVFVHDKEPKPKSDRIRNGDVDGAPTPPEPEKPGDKAGDPSKWRRLLGKKLTKKQWIASALVLVAAVLGGSAAFALTWPQPAPPIVVHAAPPPPKPDPIYSPLSGLAVTAKQAKLPVTGVMIENSLPARPQSGLSRAGVVYEAIAEAGITRFLALFQENQPSNIGPVRSARPYFVRWDLGYGAPYAHVGGSPEALADIKNWGVKDLDQFSAAGYYHRTSNRAAPHNMYTSMKKLRQLEKSRGWAKPSHFTGFARQDGKPLKKPTAGVIHMNPSTSAYAVKYVYSKKLNAYKRSEGGQPHIDAGTRKQIAPSVVVALIISYGHESDGYHSYYENVGSGAAYVFQDGGVTKCQWQKDSKSAPLKLVDSNGQNIKLNRGQTWLTALSSLGELSYKP